MIFDKRDEKSMMMKRQEQMMRSGVKPKERKLRGEGGGGGEQDNFGRQDEMRVWGEVVNCHDRAFFLSRLRQPDTQILHKWTRKIY